MTDYLAQYEAYLLHVKNASENTVASYLRDVKQFYTYVTGTPGHSVESVEQDQLLVYFAWMTNHGKSKATVTRSLASIKDFYTFLQSSGVVESNPAKSVHLEKSEKKLPQILTGQVARFVQHVETMADNGEALNRALEDKDHPRVIVLNVWRSFVEPMIKGGARIDEFVEFK
jgi:site-specific recombinase XerD